MHRDSKLSSQQFLHQAFFLFCYGLLLSVQQHNRSVHCRKEGNNLLLLIQGGKMNLILQPLFETKDHLLNCDSHAQLVQGSLQIPGVR